MHLGCEGFVNYTFFVPLNKSLALIVNEIFFQTFSSNLQSMTFLFHSVRYSYQE